MTWNEVALPSGVPNSGYNSFAIDPVSGALNLVNNAGFLLRSADNGRTWTRSDDPPKALTSILAIDPVTSAIYAAASDSYVDKPVHAFVAKLNPAGAVLWASLLGGSGTDQANAIALDLLGRVWVAGDTNSTDFPLVNAFQPALSRADAPNFTDAFVSTIDGDGGKLLFSTYLGGTGIDSASAVAVDSTGQAYVTGATEFGVFPVLHPLRPSPAMTTWASFLAKIDSSTQKLSYSMLLTGGHRYPFDKANALAVDATGAVWIGGATGGTDLPLINPVQSSPGTGFVARLARGGNSFDFSSYVGDSDTGIQALALSPNGGVWAAGSDGSLANISLAAASPGVPIIRGLYNAASYRRSDVISPGELLTIVGYELAGDTSVTIGGIPAPLLYTSSGQLNLEVPVELPLGATTLEIKRGDRSIARAVNVVAATPGIFTIVHANDYSPVTDQNPAHPGEYLVILCTGLGVTDPPAVTGEIATMPARTQAEVFGYPSTVTYAGLAPGFVGLYQVNVQLSRDANPGQFPVSLYIANMSTNIVTITVR